jgi:hypothetical protein
VVRTCVRHDRCYTGRSPNVDTHPELVGGVVRGEPLHAKPLANMTELVVREKQRVVVLARKFRVRARLPQ